MHGLASSAHYYSPACCALSVWASANAEFASYQRGQSERRRLSGMEAHAERSGRGEGHSHGDGRSSLVSHSQTHSSTIPWFVRFLVIYESIAARSEGVAQGGGRLAGLFPRALSAMPMLFAVIDIVPAGKPRGSHVACNLAPMTEESGPNRITELTIRGNATGTSSYYE